MHAATLDHQAYDAWLKKEVEDALNDPRPSIPHQEVVALLDQKIHALKANRILDRV